MAKQLNKEALDILKADPELFGAVAKALELAPLSMPLHIRNNSRRLTEAASTELIAAKLGKPVSDIVEEVPSEEAVK